MRKRWIFGAAVILLLLAAAYTVYWFWAARLFEQNLAGWISQQQLQGYRISFEGSERTGFPFAVERRFSRVEIEPPPGAQSWQLRAERLRVGILPWSPSLLTIDRGVDNAEYEIDCGSGLQRRRFAVGNGNGGMAIRLSDDGPASSIEFAGAPLAIYENLGSRRQRLALLEDVEAHIELLPDGPSLLDPSANFSLTIGRATIDAAARIPLGPTLSDAALAGRLVGRIPAGPIAESLAAWRDDGGALELTEVRAGWGALFLSGTGTLALDQRLQPLAAGTARLRDYVAALDALAAAGLLAPAQALAAKVALSATARPAADGSGEPEAEVPLTVQDGALYVGPLLLMQLPRIEWE